MGLLATIKRNGGATLNAATLTDASNATGYAVGLAKGTAIVLPEDADDTTLGLAMRLIAGAYDCSFIGAWVAADGVHLDPVAIIRDRTEAERIGRGNNQQAIYDLGKGEEVTL
jgi:hypothetical protein